jgi:hypothetical protein
VADFDGDGHLDVAVVGDTGATTATLGIHLGHGDGSFDSPPQTFAVPGGRPDGYNTTGPNRIAVGDLNGDGKPDIASIAQYEGSVTVLLNGSVPPTTTSGGNNSSNPVGPGTPGAPPPDKTAPAITALSLSNKKFAVGPAATAITAVAKRGTKLNYTLSEAARVTISITHQAKGWRKRAACVKSPPRHGSAKRCLRSVLNGTLTRTGSTGGNVLVFSGRIGRKALAPGTYKMTLTAVDAARNKSQVRAVGFTVVRR